MDAAARGHVPVKSFEEHLASVLSRSREPQRLLPEGECQSRQGHRCTLCHAVALTYDREVKLKSEALHSYWNQHFPADRLAPLVASPSGRGYRTVTKRRAFRVRGSVRLGLISPTEQGRYEPFEVIRCAIEPERHALLYQEIQSILLKPSASPLAEVLAYAVVKGNYTEYALILNVREVTPGVVRAANSLSKSLTKLFSDVMSIFLLHDTSDGRYYLGSSRQEGNAVRKLFGRPDITQKICGKTFRYPPLSFSQVNISLIDRFVETTGSLLELEHPVRLIDLYCGYGLFSVCLAHRVHSVIGVELSPESVDAALANAQRNRTSNIRFLRAGINPESLYQALKASRGSDAVLLDPPRNGTGPGVIEYIAARKPLRVLHIFCNIDIMPAELERWKAGGYSMQKAVPFDMFPGTTAMEMMVLLAPTQV
jgi:tRNA/tmRNA/rRNA uracil-C5-methylase (TrmA/RlmC/RlmD family)